MRQPLLSALLAALALAASAQLDPLAPVTTDPALVVAELAAGVATDLAAGPSPSEQPAGYAASDPLVTPGGGGREAAAEAPAAGPPPPPGVDQPVIYAETNYGLRPNRWYSYNRLHYYQIPEEPRGTLVFFHGCSRRASVFFPYDPVHCKECLGFPEHVSQVKQALTRGYAVLVLEPNDNRHLCWSSSNRKPYVNDQPFVTEAITKFLVKNELTEKPVYLLGASSGGTLALKLAASLENGSATLPRSKSGFKLKVDGIIAEVATPSTDEIGVSDSNGRFLVKNYPPTVFVIMERGKSDEPASLAVDFFRKNGIPSDMTKSPVRQVNNTYFSDRIPVITPQQSAAIAAGLKQLGMLDDEGYLTADPSEENDRRLPSFQWSRKLRWLLPWLKVNSNTLSLVFRQSAIYQALNVAYARHDAVSDYLTACLVWLESGGKDDFQELLKQYTVPDFNLTALNAGFPPAPPPSAPSLPPLPPAPLLPPSPLLPPVPLLPPSPLPPAPTSAAPPQPSPPLDPVPEADPAEALPVAQASTGSGEVAEQPPGGTASGAAVPA